MSQPFPIHCPNPSQPMGPSIPSAAGYWRGGKGRPECLWRPKSYTLALRQKGIAKQKLPKKNSGHYITNPNNVFWRANPSKLSVHLHCLIPPIWLIQWSLTKPPPQCSLSFFPNALSKSTQHRFFVIGYLSPWRCFLFTESIEEDGEQIDVIQTFWFHLQQFAVAKMFQKI